MELNEEVQHLRKKVDQNMGVAKAQFQSKVLNNLISERNLLFEKLEKSLNSQSPIQGDIDLLLDSLRVLRLLFRF